MKKILASLLVLALCAPAMAATVSFTDNTDGTGTFTITGDGVLMVGLGLDVTADADVTDVAIAGELSSVAVPMDVYPDAAHTQELGTGYVYGTGTPYCAQNDAGEITLASSPQAFTLCFANLNGETTAGASGADTVTITISAPNGTQVSIAENAKRGGVVGTNGEDVVLGGTLSGTITAGPAECITSADTDYTDWVNLGKPNSWCNQRQCHGDADGLENEFGPTPPPIIARPTSWVTVEDLNILVSGYQDQTYVDEATDPWIAADFNRRENEFGPTPPPIISRPTARVTVEDLNILVTNYQAQSGINEDCNQ